MNEKRHENELNAVHRINHNGLLLWRLSQINKNSPRSRGCFQNESNLLNRRANPGSEISPGRPAQSLASAGEMIVAGVFAAVGISVVQWLARVGNRLKNQLTHGHGIGCGEVVRDG